jgi:vacuolar protein sorting-associated protein 13A/C
MLEGLVASLLNRFLGMYIRNFDPKQLNVGIWSGDVKLRDLELRREALDQLKLPINVVEGHLGQLTLKIPWSNLRGQPVQVYIEDVFVLAAPKEDAEWDEEEEERRRQAVKIEKLDSAEMLKDRNQEGLRNNKRAKVLRKACLRKSSTICRSRLKISTFDTKTRYPPLGIHSPSD